MLNFIKYTNNLPHKMDDADRDMFHDMVNLYQGSLDDGLLFTLAVNEVMNNINFDIVEAYVKNEVRLGDLFIEDVMKEFNLDELPESVVEAIFNFGMEGTETYKDCYDKISKVVHILELTFGELILCLTS